MQYLAVLGRQPEISLAELEALFSDVKKQSCLIAFFKSDAEPRLARLGGSLKLAKKLENISPEEYLLGLPDGKITLGLSDYTYGDKKYSSRDIKNISQYGNRIKQALKAEGRSVRLLPNSTPTISTAAAHHNGLGRSPKKVELIKFRGDWFVSLGSQNITAYKNRDQVRPARDAKVGMLPPKLAQILINLCGPLPIDTTILDPFCGTGVVLQEALLMGYNVYGTDKDERMVKYTEKNLIWLSKKQHLNQKITLEQGDATSFQWTEPFGAVVAETYLGPPMSEPPADIKLKTAKEECGAIFAGFLKNLAPQITHDTPIVLALPAWRRRDGSFARLKTIDEIEKLGYNVLNKSAGGLLYARENQVVAREIIVLRKK
ncbi:methyltransferase domain-containing protein [Candidatus Saccharibacteria bacterium]|nr:methyltransferase domain-containing protein [Candidatus Saccharibacteria bacterium]